MVIFHSYVKLPEGNKEVGHHGFILDHLVSWLAGIRREAAFGIGSNLREMAWRGCGTVINHVTKDWKIM